MDRQTDALKHFGPALSYRKLSQAMSKDGGGTLWTDDLRGANALGPVLWERGLWPGKILENLN